MSRDSWLKRLIWLRGSPAGGSGASYEKTVGPAPILSISDAKPKPAKSLIVGMEPIQDLHGYDSPWPAGGGKNKLNPLATYKGCAYNTDVGTTLNPVAADKSWQDAGNDTFTISNLGSWSQACLISDPLPLGEAYVKISNVRGAVRCSVYVCNGDFKVNRVSYNGNPVPEGDTITVNTTFTNDDTYFVVYLSGGGADASIQYPYAYSGDTAATDSFSPYSNICPISGRTGLNVYHSGEDTSNPTVYPISWQTEAGTVYGGTVDLVSGVLTVTDAEIASYNGETLPSTWISDRDVYAEGTTPTIGAQVVYELATPQTYQLTPTQIQLLKGSNTLWSDANDLTLTYIGTTWPNLLGGMLGGGLGGGYNPPAEQDPEELTEPEATETDEPTKETPAEEGENNGE